MFRVDRAGSTQKKASLIERNSYWTAAKAAGLPAEYSQPPARRRSCKCFAPTSRSGRCSKTLSESFAAARSLPNEAIGFFSLRPHQAFRRVSELRVARGDCRNARLHCFHVARCTQPDHPKIDNAKQFSPTISLCASRFGSGALGPDVMEDESGDDETKENPDTRSRTLSRSVSGAYPWENAVKESECDWRPA